MAHFDTHDLQLYVDGELSKSREQKLSLHLQDCESCNAAVERVRSVGSLLRIAAEEMAEEASFEAMADAVLDQVRHDKPLPWGERAGAWLREFFRHRKRVWVPSMAALGAATAVALFAFGPPLTEPPSLELPPGSNVLSVSFGNSVEGSLFQVEDKDGSTTAIIWVGEGEADSEVKQT